MHSSSLRPLKLLTDAFYLAAISYELSTPQLLLDTGHRLCALRCVNILWFPRLALSDPNESFFVDMECDSPPSRRYRYPRQDGFLSFQAQVEIVEPAHASLKIAQPLDLFRTILAVNHFPHCIFAFLILSVHRLL